MAVNDARLALNAALRLLEDMILLLRLELNDNPSPDREMELRSDISDLLTRKSELRALRGKLAQSDLDIPPPSDDIMQEVRALSRKVEQATDEGAAAEARTALVAEGLAVLTKVASHFPTSNA